MRPQEIIERKRDGRVLTETEIQSFVDGVTNGAWADYQITALVMAMFIRGLNKGEQHAITSAMLHSGTVMDLSDIDAPKADKHSTGGVGDKTSLIIAPLAAACGIAVPMISGRGLGHTGGTLDKLESIPGFNVRLTFPKFKRILKDCGLALAGQTRHIAPADRKLYALRDATATVPCIPLIVASIMSKKLAEGLDALVLDVKTGSGAFIDKYSETVKLAKALTETGRSFGVKTRALITDMSQPLGKYVGNAFEVYECVKILRGEIEPAMQSTLDLSIELTAQMLLLTKVEKTEAAAHDRLKKALASGDALERFRRNIDLQGGDASVCDRPESLIEKSLGKISVTAASGGFISSINTSCIGQCVGDLGGGRVKAADKIDHAVGYSCSVRLGDKVRSGDELGVIYCRTSRQAAKISEKLQSAYKISSEKPKTTKLIRTTV
ncbi:MAG TPA: thymidine phosphorylase [Pyrinomonadaceae bacterium]|jgi:pyrimidine-nucleoside phosphorylase|nr:thymidine phosphorylase [Pyrinomonadaceae bacterium]